MVNPGDAIAEIETDKATVDFEAQDSGYIARILVAAGTADVPVGSLVAIVVDTKEEAAAFAGIPVEALLGGGTAAPAPKPAAAPAAPAPAAPAPKPAAAPAAAPAPASSSGSGLAISPLARKLATDAGVPLSALSGAGTGPGGRVIAADVREKLAALLAAAQAQAAAPAPTATAAAAAPAPAARGDYTDIPHTSMRRVIAQRLTASKQTVPHYTLTVDIELEAVLALRAQLNAALPADAKLSVNDFLIKAAALALRKVPEVNSSWLEHGIRAYNYVDVSVAVALPDGGGLITPVVKDADAKGLAAISASVRGLVDRAKAKQLKPEEYQGGTFTISNLGMFGIRQFSAIINPPQACILAVGAAERRVLPALTPDAPQPYRQAVVMSATLSCDHRVVDGAVGAQWLAAFKGLLQQPHTMLL